MECRSWSSIIVIECDLSAFALDHRDPGASPETLGPSPLGLRALARGATGRGPEASFEDPGSQGSTASELRSRSIGSDRGPANANPPGESCLYTRVFTRLGFVTTVLLLFTTWLPPDFTICLLFVYCFVTTCYYVFTYVCYVLILFTTFAFATF